MEPKNETRIRPNRAGIPLTKAHENDIGILNIIKQRLKDIELQRWLSDVNNHDVGKRRQPKEQTKNLPKI